MIKSERPDSRDPGPATRPARGARKLPRKVTAQHLENVALHYLGRFSASSTHLRQVLMRRVDRAARAHGSDPAEARPWVDALIERFCRSGLLDDAAYAAGKAKSLRRRGTSRAVIGQTLRAKGVSGDQVQTTLSTLDEASGSDGVDGERIAAARLAQRKRLGPFRAEATRAALRDRDLAALARAGFSYQIARQTVETQSAELLEAVIRGEQPD